MEEAWPLLVSLPFFTHLATRCSYWARSQESGRQAKRSDLVEWRHATSEIRSLQQTVSFLLFSLPIFLLTNSFTEDLPQQVVHRRVRAMKEA
jgi:hypothetical protein